MRIAFALAAVFLLPPAVHAITINTVPVGNANNPQDFQSNGIFGLVTSDYRIATTEVTNAQYVAFLNSVASTDPSGLYSTQMSFTSRGGIVRTGSPGSYTYSVKPNPIATGFTNYTYADKPVVFVSFLDAIRYANWVNNGATATSSTETGAYTLANGNAVTRNAGALWFLPSENQWYKAAYYDPSTSTYYDYPTKSNSQPDNHLPSADSGNSANYFNGSFTTDPNGSYPMTPVGAYTLSNSPYGTSDQAGNVSEWTETFGSTNATRITRGGAFDTDATQLNAATRTAVGLTTEIEDIGFRLATIAVPGDYNVNGVVDAADYVLWRKNLGQSITVPNDSTPGSVTGADYDVWRAHFGQTPATATPGSGLQLGAVPEPAGLLLLAVSFNLCAFIRRR